jgi:hypothetical protein
MCNRSRTNTFLSLHNLYSLVQQRNLIAP